MSPALVPIVGAICPKAGSNGLPKYHVSCRPEGDVHTQSRGRTEENRHVRFVSDTTDLSQTRQKLNYFGQNSSFLSTGCTVGCWEDLQQWVCVRCTFLSATHDGLRCALAHHVYNVDRAVHLGRNETYANLRIGWPHVKRAASL